MKQRTNAKEISKKSLYDYSGVYERQDTISFLLEYAAKNKSQVHEAWKHLRRYYDSNHDITKTNGAFSYENSLPWTPAQSTDAYIHVESQIDVSIPDFEFLPRDRSDEQKALQRERIVRYICDNNNLTVKNADNERNIGIYGNSVWKVCWDSEAGYGENNGDVAILCPNPFEIYPDPTSRDIDGCEYIGYVYKMHRQKARRVFAEDFASCGIDISDCCKNEGFFSSLGNISSDKYNAEDDTVTVTEWWFRQPTDGKTVIVRGKNKYSYEWKAGDIALSVLVGGKEVRYIPKYWKKTSFSSYPFVISTRVPDNESVWGKSELSWILPLIDAKDRELAYAQLNNAFSSNDIVLVEENALCDGENLDNSPGAVWKLRPGMMGKVARLGNIASSQNSLYSGALFWQNLIESTTGNFEISQGKEPDSVTTATGIALLGERSESRRRQKNVGRNEGFNRLYRLVDMTALENYSDGRVIRIGAAQEDDVVFDFGGFIKKTRTRSYIPSVDVKIHTGQDFSNSRAFTVSALTSLMQMNITEENYELVKAYLKSISIPESERLCEYLDERFKNDSDSREKAKDFINLIEKTLSEEEIDD